MNRFCGMMKKYIGKNATINVFSIQPGEANFQASTVKVFDVRFTARALSSYVTSNVLNGLIMQHRSELEDVIGAQIVSGGNDMCKYTSCDRGCHTVHHANEAGYLISANQTVILGINTWSKDSCECPVFKPPSSCRAGICRNGGICHNTYPTGFFCECRNSSSRGFRCQGTTRSFNGAGYAWFKPIPACTSLNITLQFMTSELNGLLLYNGPFGKNTSANHLDYSDYLAIRLNGGKIEAEYAFSGNLRNVLHVPNATALNDGKWHSVRFMQIGRSAELVLDDYADRAGNPISVNSSFHVITSKAQYFNGCIRDLIVNGEEYDLGVPDLTDEENTSPGCSMNAAVCGIDNSYCRHGECVADASSSLPKCICDPGYSGVQCDLEVEWVEFGPEAFIEYDVSKFASVNRSNIGLLILPGSGTGTLGHGGIGNQYFGTYLSEFSPGAFVDVPNDLPMSMEMNFFKMNSNYSYWIQFIIAPTRVTLTVDGAHYLSADVDPVENPLKLKVKELVLGVKKSAATNFQFCIGMLWWDHHSLPLLQNGSLPQDIASDSDTTIIQRSEGVKPGCSMRATCATIVCSSPLICVDFWKGPFCTCPENFTPVLDQDGTVLRCEEVISYVRGDVQPKFELGDNKIILLGLGILGLLLLLLLLLMILFSRRKASSSTPIRPAELNYDNIRPYDIEGDVFLQL
uniref:LAM_G_DOMAIN domain-containing protein n=1 Tax=Syphacia muris TaxID=451379 RepID=A0A0N5AZQ8_9BILA